MARQLPKGGYVHLRILFYEQIFIRNHSDTIKLLLINEHLCIVYFIKCMYSMCTGSELTEPQTKHLRCHYLSVYSIFLFNESSLPPVGVVISTVDFQWEAVPE